MENTCTIQLFSDSVWHDVATVSLFGQAREGWRARTYSGYAVEWAFSHGKARDAHALGCQIPVGLDPFEQPHWPVFLIDMLPQGFGRNEMLRRLGVPTTAQESADWQLLKAGAGNPIGNLRVKEAALWLQANAGPTRGFTAEEVALRSDDFAEYLGSHGLFVAGSSGVQGEWPKLLLTRATDGLLYLDHTLEDARACEHYIVKFGRGSDVRLASILRHEAPYMGLAQRLWLSPLYDFAPMYLHPDGIARRLRWENNDASNPDWSRVLQRIAELEAEVLALARGKHQKGAARLQRDALVTGLKAMIAPLQDIALNGQTMGLEPDVLAHLRPHILCQVRSLSTLN